MDYRSEDIRAAMLTLAKQKGREYYELAVVSDVLKAFREDKHHDLKSELLVILNRTYFKVTHESFLSIKTKGGKTNKEQFANFYKHARMFLGAMKMLAKHSGIPSSSMSYMLKKGYMLEDTYLRLEPHFKTIQKYKAENFA